MSYRKLLPQMVGVMLVALLLVGCEAPEATPTPLVPTVTPTPLVPTDTPIPPTLTPECTPGSIDTAELVWPQLHEVQPVQVAAGDQIKVIGSGGYLYWWNDDCQKGYNESHRTFQLAFDGESVGSISCYVNHCEATLTVAADALPGTHTISVEGGSSIDVQVTSN